MFTNHNQTLFIHFVLPFFRNFFHQTLDGMAVVYRCFKSTFHQARCVVTVDDCHWPCFSALFSFGVHWCGSITAANVFKWIEYMFSLTCFSFLSCLFFLVLLLYVQQHLLLFTITVLMRSKITFDAFCFHSFFQCGYGCRHKIP